MSDVVIRVRGLVQGVGFRPTVWRLARKCQLLGDVRNDGHGVLIRLRGTTPDIEHFCQRLYDDCPPLARIDSMVRDETSRLPAFSSFDIVDSDAGDVHTGVIADAATCAACGDDIADPSNRRYRYPFTNCTHCGPRLSIVRGIPYDRANTSMSMFTMCPACQREYSDPADRRFHAQPNACPVCGPKAWLSDAEGRTIQHAEHDAVAAASRLLGDGAIIAIKGIGGFHLACDACNTDAVDELRRRKQRFGKPFALMANDLDVIRQYAHVDNIATQTLSSSAAPVVLLPRIDSPSIGPIAAGVAPGQSTLGFMLPYSPLHKLLLDGWERPLVMTSGNISEEPQCIANDEVQLRLRTLADYCLLHDREIVNRVDDSVVRIMHEQPRLLRRARGYAPAPIPLPDGFADLPPVLALGGELKNTICLLKDGEAIVSQHLGDLEDARTADEFERSVTLYHELFDHRPLAIAIDQHPNYRSSRFGQALAETAGLPLHEIQHHHAHIASVLADNAWPLDAPDVIGVALDGLGFGDDGTVWGGEFLLAGYRGYRRLAHLTTVPMLGGTKAILEPWRNSYAHIAQHIGWERVSTRYADLALVEYLGQKPLATLDAMMLRGVNSPLSSSCGRLFDAVAAALNISADAVAYEGQAAIELEAVASQAAPIDPVDGYPFTVRDEHDCWRLDPTPMWQAVLDDIQQGAHPSTIAVRFHAGLAMSTASLAARLAQRHGVDTVALSGGVMQNHLLFEAIADHLQDHGLKVLSHIQVPSNDGGLSLGQAVIGACRARD